MLGRTIQNYRVEELLGEGGMGTVYKASDTLLHRPVALKMLHPHLVRDTTFMERFRNEAILSARLNHPNVTTLYNFIQDHQDSIIVMELVSGITVEKFLKQHGTLDIETSVRIISQTLDGLQHAHSKGILHRDIKAANLMLTQEGSIKLMDFGIARLEGSTRLTRADRIIGTLEYMAPELINGAEPSAQSDLYAVGVLLYELMSGKMPFESSTDLTLISQILTKKPIALRSRIPDLPPAIEQILDKLFQKNPEKRFRSAAELKAALGTVVATGNIDISLFNTTPKAIPATVLAQRQQEKPQPNPTRLAGIETSAETSFWGIVKANLLSLEGKILLAALLFAGGILSVWSFSGPGPVKVEKDSTLIQPESASLALDQSTTPAQQESSVEKTPALYQQPIPQKSIEEIPAEPTPTTPVANKKKKPETAKPEAVEPDEPETPVVERKEPEKPVKRISIPLKGETFSAELNESISTEYSHAGQTIWLRTTSAVQVNGVTVISSGARVRGKIEKVNSKADHKRAGLWFHLEDAEAVDGQWIPVSFKWDDTAFHALELKRGMVLKKIRTAKATISLVQ
jgi:serine/threonine protein kinase